VFGAIPQPTITMLSQKQEGRKKALQSEKESSDARFQDLGHELAAEVADYQDEVSRVRRKALKDEGVRLVDDVAKQKESFERVTLQLDRLQKVRLRAHFISTS